MEDAAPEIDGEKQGDEPNYATMRNGGNGVWNGGNMTKNGGHGGGTLCIRQRENGIWRNNIRK